MSEKVNLAEKLATFTEHWAPRTVTEFNGHDVMVVKVQGPFVWHKHDDTDDFFFRCWRARSTSKCLTARSHSAPARSSSYRKTSNTARSPRKWRR